MQMPRLFEVTDIARMCHEVNRAYCEATGDTSQLPWEYAEPWQRESAIKGVDVALAGATPEQQHEAWCKDKYAAGWVYGDVKNAEAKTHQCLVPYAELSDAQKVRTICSLPS